MELKLPLNKVKEFIALSKAVETETSDLDNLQVLKYIKIEIDFDTCTLTKTSLKAFVQLSFDLKAPDSSILVLEKELVDFCSFSNRDTVTITQEPEKDMVLSDGYTYSEHYNGKYEVKDFFKIPKYGKPTVRIPKDVLMNLRFARIYSGTDDLRPMFKYIYIDSMYDEDRKMQVSYMYSSTMRIFFFKRFDYNLPKISLSKEECVALSGFEFIDYCQSEIEGHFNWNIFKNNNTVYGFRQSDEAKGFTYSNFLDIKKNNYIVFKLEDLINFCNSTKIRMSKADGKATYINSKVKLEKSITGYRAELICDDNENRKKNRIFTDVTVEGEPFDFIIDHSQMLDIFKSLPFNEICISNEQKRNDEGVIMFDALGLFSKLEESYFSLVSKLVS